jgi:hypothetical protein
VQQPPTPFPVMESTAEDDESLQKHLLAGELPNGVQDVDTTIFRKVIQLIQSDDLTTAEKACILSESIIKTSDQHQSLLAIMTSETVKFAATDTNIYLRYANIWARLLGQNNSLFASCLLCGAVTSILSMCRSAQDVLVQIVALELLEEFGKTSSGLQYLFQEGMIDWLVSIRSSSANESLLANEAYHQLGRIFSTASSNSLMTEVFWSAIEKDLIGHYMTATSQFLDSRSESDRLTGDTIPHLLSNVHECILIQFYDCNRTGLYALSSFASSCEGAFSALMTDHIILDSYLGLLNSGKVEIVTATLFAIARIINTEAFPSSSTTITESTTADDGHEGALQLKHIELESSEDIRGSSKLMDLKTQLVSAIGVARGMPFVLYLMKIGSQPIIERKLAVYAVLYAICSQQPGGWGLKLLYGTSGFKEFLEDRQTEQTKDGKDAKFRWKPT